MARKIPATYECEKCYKVFKNEMSANECEASHAKAVKITGNGYNKDGGESKYPEYIQCIMSDGKILIFRLDHDHY